MRNPFSFLVFLSENGIFVAHREPDALKNHKLSIAVLTTVDCIRLAQPAEPIFFNLHILMGTLRATSAEPML